MDYAVHYNRLILRAKGRVLEGYKERHHVLPRCMGGGNEPGNIAELTPEEHYVAHQLLVKMHPGVSRYHGLVWAAVNMARRAGRNKAYGWLRRELAEQVSRINTGNKYSVGRKHTAEQRARNSAARIGKQLSKEHAANIARALKGRKMSPESIAKSAAAQRGQKRKPHTAEARAKIGAASKGNTYALGKKHAPRSTEHRANLAAALRGRKLSPETRAKISAVQIGKKLSPEHKARISAGMKGKRNCLGRTLSQEHRANITATHRLPETRAKVSAALKGRVPWNKGKQSVQLPVEQSNVGRL